MSTSAGEASLNVTARIIRFAVVGTLCFLLQLGLMHALNHVMHLYCADVIAFLLSAQLNFVLSQVFTWADRQQAERLPIRWLKFNANALVSVAIINGMVFWLLVEAGLWFWAAMLIANIASTIWTFVVNHFLVFKAEQRRQPKQEEPLVVLEKIVMHILPLAKAPLPSVALFMPAFNEAANLFGVVTRAFEFFDRAGIEKRAVIIVDDGSTDETSAVVEDLKRTYPVQVVVHPVNSGYGRALRSGFNAALATGCEWVAFCDSDGQFNPGDLALLLVAAYSHDVNVVLGVRAKRADNLARRAAGRTWHGVSRLVLKFNAADVDCGFKLLHRTAIGTVADHLRSDYAAISPELLARLYRAGQQVVEVPVPHYPRVNGTQTGLRASVVIRSFVDLYNVRQELAADRAGVAAAHGQSGGFSPFEPIAGQEAI